MTNHQWYNTLLVDFYSKVEFGPALLPCPEGQPNAVLTCVLGGAVVAEGKNRDAQISQVENSVRFHTSLPETGRQSPSFEKD